MYVVFEVMANEYGRDNISDDMVIVRDETDAQLIVDELNRKVDKDEGWSIDLLYYEYKEVEVLDNNVISFIECFAINDLH